MTRIADNDTAEAKPKYLNIGPNAFTLKIKDNISDYSETKEKNHLFVFYVNAAV